MLKTIVFIVGMSHTGSTLLSLMLGRHESCTALGESYRYKKKDCGICGESCKYWDKVTKCPKQQGFFNNLFDVFKTPILIDSSKKEDWVRDVVLSKKYNTKIIRTYREGGSRLSVYKRRYGKIEPEQIERWIQKEKKIRWALRGIKYIKIKYEDLCNSDGLKKACKYIGIDYSKNMRNYWEAISHIILANTRTCSLIKAYHNLPITNEEQAFVEKNGYQVSEIVNRLNAKELEMFEAKQGLKLNRKLGYELPK